MKKNGNNDSYSVFFDLAGCFYEYLTANVRLPDDFLQIISFFHQAVHIDGL